MVVIEIRGSPLFDLHLHLDRKPPIVIVPEFNGVFKFIKKNDLSAMNSSQVKLCDLASFKRMT